MKNLQKEVSHRPQRVMTEQEAEDFVEKKFKEYFESKAKN